jgi:hypothetical protein
MYHNDLLLEHVHPESFTYKTFADSGHGDESSRVIRLGMVYYCQGKLSVVAAIRRRGVVVVALLKVRAI